MLTLERDEFTRELHDRMRLESALDHALGGSWQILPMVPRLGEPALRVALHYQPPGPEPAKMAEVVFPLLDTDTAAWIERIRRTAEGMLYWRWSPSSDLPMEIDGWFEAMGPRALRALLS